jgi:hypothetical protein
MIDRITEIERLLASLKLEITYSSQSNLGQYVQGLNQFALQQGLNQAAQQRASCYCEEIGRQFPCSKVGCTYPCENCLGE